MPKSLLVEVSTNKTLTPTPQVTRPGKFLPMPNHMPYPTLDPMPDPTPDHTSNPTPTPMTLFPMELPTTAAFPTPMPTRRPTPPGAMPEHTYLPVCW